MNGVIDGKKISIRKKSYGVVGNRTLDLIQVPSLNAKDA